MNEIEKYYTFLTIKLSEYKSIDKKSSEISQKNNVFFSIYLILFSLSDTLLLAIRLIFSKNSNLVYTTKSFCYSTNGKLNDRILNNMNLKNRIYINQGKDSIIKSIDGYKTYNIGIIIRFLSLFTMGKNKSLKYLNAYVLLNNIVLGLYRGKNVYSLCYYDMNGLSLVFSKHRKKIELIEVQHGGIINFPAYSTPSNIKVADKFIVKNLGTISYLKENLNKKFSEISYELLPILNYETHYKDGVHILYASTIEFNGIHPLFESYLNLISKNDNITVYIRLHPREKDKKKIFIKQTENTNAKIIFDESKNWLESNKIKNLIVVSPWSSVIEDATDNGYKAIILDPIGKERFDYLIDDKNVIFADNLDKLSLQIKK